MRVKRTLSYAAELGGGNIHEFSSSFLIWSKYWYTNNLTKELDLKFHKTQRRNDIQTLGKLEYDQVADYLFRITDDKPNFIGLAVERLTRVLKIDEEYIKQMCAAGLLQRGYYRPKEPRKFLGWEIRGTDEIEVVFPTRKLVAAYFVKKERSGESREIHSKELKKNISL